MNKEEYKGYDCIMVCDECDSLPTQPLDLDDEVITGFCKICQESTQYTCLNSPLSWAGYGHIGVCVGTYPFMLSSG